jgi:D-alanyl-D-alanine carboxypeptidase/D-alanyl-D-alanine-endopeptidase (penicillin-binding protein 4)
MKQFFLILLIPVWVAISCNREPEKPPVTVQAAVPDTIKDTLPKKTQLQIEIELFADDPVMKNGSFGLLVVDAATGEVIAEHDPDLSLVPASTMKLFTTAAALEILGPDKRFRTSFGYEGRIADGVLVGNIVIKGGGDPTLGMGEQTRKILYYNWIDKIKKAGIDSVNGSVIADGTLFDKDYIPYTWTWGEINLAYCAAASGLSVNGNTFMLFIEARKRDRFRPALEKVCPYIPDQYFENRTVEMENQEEEIYLVGHPFSDQKMIRGVIPAGKEEAALVASVSNPPLAFAADFMNAMIKKGITVSGRAVSLADSDSLDKFLEKARMNELSGINSPTVASIIHTTNQNSYNFFAETLLKHMGLKIMRYGSTDAGANAVYNYFRNKGMDTDGLYIFDGSGISRYNSATARQMVWVLNFMQSSPDRDIFRNSLSVAGVSGTLGHLLSGTPAEGNLLAKSGTMSRVKSYAGYIHAVSGRELIFAVIVNNFNCPSPEMTRKLEKIMKAMATSE